jgi:hypothetical protein
VILFSMFRSGQVNALKLANIGWLYGVFAGLLMVFG